MTAASGNNRRLSARESQEYPVSEPWNCFAFGFQHQPPLPRRLAPNAFAGVWAQGRLWPKPARAVYYTADFPDGRSGGWSWNHE
jgi:hypothetical protein